MYKIGDKDLELRIVCAKSLKVCKELGLLNRGAVLTKEEQDLVIKALEEGEDGLRWDALEIFKRNPIVNEMEIYLNPEKLIKLIDAVFSVTPEELKELGDKWEELNTETIIQGAFEFLGKLEPSSSKLPVTLKDLLSLIPQTETAN